MHSDVGSPWRPAGSGGREPARSPRGIWVALLLTLVLFAPASSARGEWYEHYEDALRAIEKGRPRRAVDSLGSALARQSRSGYLRTHGNNYLRYAPQYWLGVAYHDLDDCERALASFERSDGAEETTEEPALAARLRSLRSACERRLDLPPEPRIAAGAAASPLSPAGPLVADPATREPGQVPATDAWALERGLSAYLAGDLADAVRIFEDLARDAPDSATPHLLLGMALHGQWSAGGQSTPELLERSRRELARAAELDPRVVPDPALCSPAVVALYRSLR